MIHIGWYSRDDYLDLYAQLARHLAEMRPHEFRFSHVTHSKLEKRELLEKHQVSDPIYCLNHYLKENWASFNISAQNLHRLESEYGFPSLSTYLLGDYFILKADYRKLLKLLVGHIGFFEEYFQKEKPDFFISERGSIIATNVAWALCQRHKATFLCFLKLPIEKSFCISSSYLGFPEQLEREYVRLKGSELTSEDLKKASDFIDAFHGSPKKTSDIIYMASKPRVPLSPQQFLRFLRKLSDYYRDSAYYISNPVHRELWRLSRVLRYRLYDLLRIFDEADYGKKYVLYPLHRMIEWSMHCSAPFTYADQLGVVSNIALSLPLDHVLYVKEHTGLIGHRPISFYKQIKKLPKVSLISPYEDTFELIRNASAVAVLSGSMGWEGILFKKPVIALGSTWYDPYAGLFKAGDPKELPLIMKEAINSTPPSNDELKRFVLAVLNIKRDGYVRVIQKDKVLRPENIKALSHALAEKIEEKRREQVGPQLRHPLHERLEAS